MRAASGPPQALGLNSSKKECRAMFREVDINNNGALTSIHGLRGVRGLLPGALHMTNNPELASLSGLELLIGVEAKDNYGFSLNIRNNAVLCLSAPDRARFLNGTRFSLPDAGNSGVTFTQAERTDGCVTCPAAAACDGTGNEDATAPCFSVAAADTATCPVQTQVCRRDRKLTVIFARLRLEFCSRGPFNRLFFPR